MRKFEPVYRAEVGKKHSFLFASGGKVPTDQPWFGIYFRSVQEQDPSTLESLKQFFHAALSRRRYDIMMFMQVETGASAAEVQALGAMLNEYGPQKNSPGLATLIWLADAREVAPAARIDLGVAPDQRKKSSKRVNVIAKPERSPVFPLNGGGDVQSLMFVNATSNSRVAGKIRVAANEAGDAITIASRGGLSICSGGERAVKKRLFFTVDDDQQFEIPLTGPQIGCVLGAGVLKTGIPEIGPAIRYTIHNEDIDDANVLDAPLVQDYKALDGQPVNVSLCPSAPFQADRTYVALGPDAKAITSTFRTRTGQGIDLVPDPQGTSHFAFNQSAGGARYLTPDGAFLTGVEGQSGAANWLCGLSGVEYVGFQIGDAMNFYPGQPASVLATIRSTLSQAGNITFSRNAQGVETTAWAMIGPADETSEEARAYYSEPDNSPFFARAYAAGKETQLGYMELSRRVLTRTLETEDLRCFPVVPYAGIPAGLPGMAGDPATVRAFEVQYLNPARRDAIAAPGDAVATVPDLPQGTVHAVTPQGYQATFENGAWTGIKTADLAGEDRMFSVSFAPGEGQTELPGLLQDAFLTNQQFLVISDATKNLGSFQPVIKMDGWSFKLDLGGNTIPGDYRNVVIFKSANASLAQLAANPQLWTERTAFNDTSMDKDGRFLSRWLVSYIEQARMLHNEGKGVASLMQFCTLVDDPEWNGFIALKVSVDIGALAPELEVLLAGVDRDLFAAHHVGNLTNHTTPKSDGAFEISSSPFGLIHYVDPSFGTQTDVSYISTPQAYDFRVLTLEAVFKDAALSKFSNKSLLLMNKIFGDAVSAVEDEQVPRRNVVTLVGTYKKRGTVHTYSFASPPGASSRFLLESSAIETVQIKRATMNLVSDGAGDKTRYLVRFTLWGGLSFLEKPAFDLLSFQSVGFQNLAVDMTLTLDPETKDSYLPQFVFVTSDMALEQNRLSLYDPESPKPEDTVANLVRKGSLLSQFPLKLNGFVSGTSTALPETQGFKALETTSPKEISAADLAGGDWNGISFEMNLGSQGVMAANAPLAANLILAWPAGSDGAVNVAPYIKLSGPAGMSLSFDIQGVIKFGASGVALNKVKSKEDVSEPDAYVMIFESIALSVLTLSFPPAGTTNIYLLGGLDTAGSGDEIAPTLGWFGGYAAKDPSTPEEV